MKFSTKIADLPDLLLAYLICYLIQMREQVEGIILKHITLGGGRWED